MYPVPGYLVGEIRSTFLSERTQCHHLTEDFGQSKSACSPPSFQSSPPMSSTLPSSFSSPSTGTDSLFPVTFELG